MDALSASIVLNYLAIHDLTGFYSDVLPDGPSLTGDLDELIAFAPIKNLTSV